MVTKLEIHAIRLIGIITAEFTIPITIRWRGSEHVAIPFTIYVVNCKFTQYESVKTQFMHAHQSTHVGE